jgi:hypothetical protein
MKRSLLALTLALGAMAPARALTLLCPDPAAAVQVGACPSEEELKHTYTGFCADNANLYGKDQQTCASYENYRKAKNIALWESKDGVFQAYISCDLPAAALKRLKPVSISVGMQGKLTRLACLYTDEVVFTHRSKAACKVSGDGNCAADAAACRAECN